MYSGTSLYIAATIGEQHFGCYIGVAFIEGLFCTQTVHLGPGFLAVIQRCLYSGVAVKRDSTVLELTCYLSYCIKYLLYSAASAEMTVCMSVAAHIYVKSLLYVTNCTSATVKFELLLLLL